MDAWVLVRMALGLALLVGGAELLVRGASRLAASAGVSALVIGLTVVAYGTGAPELAVSVKSSVTGQGALALGNVVGSNIFNVLFLLGLAALIAPLAVSRQLVRRDVPLMIGASGLVYLLALDGRLSRVDGLALLVCLAAYTGFTLHAGRAARPPEREFEELGEVQGGPPAAPVVVNVVMVLAGIALLVIGADWLVDGASALAERWGISRLVIGLTIVAAGTGLPEAATSVVAALRGERDIAAGNAVGSNLFNLLAVLGLAALVAPGGLECPPAAVRFDLPVMLAAALACWPVCRADYRISRWEGSLFLVSYLAYVTWLVIAATQAHPGSRAAHLFALVCVPLLAASLLVVTARALRQERDDRRQAAGTTDAG